MKGILDFIRELVQTPSQNGIDSEKDLGGKKEHFLNMVPLLMFLSLNKEAR